MDTARSETARRRAKQMEYNRLKGITPESVKKNLGEDACSIWEADYATVPKASPVETPLEAIPATLKSLRRQMREAADNLDFERAAAIRDRIKALDATALSLG